MNDCIEQLRKDGLSDSQLCTDSPLYLYGAKGQNVKVTVGTYVYNSHPSYANVYDATLLTDGQMQVNGTLTDSINYDYNPAIKKITPPAYGKVITSGQLGTVLQDYGEKLDLNKKEIADLVTDSKKQITAPFVFVSFFSPETSENILPLAFTPQPDNYRNIVFYFKQYATQPAFTPQAPVFPAPLNRSGFTAVEISNIVE